MQRNKFDFKILFTNVDKSIDKHTRVKAAGSIVSSASTRCVAQMTRDCSPFQRYRVEVRASYGLYGNCYARYVRRTVIDLVRRDSFTEADTIIRPEQLSIRYGTTGFRRFAGRNDAFENSRIVHTARSNFGSQSFTHRNKPRRNRSANSQVTTRKDRDFRRANSSCQQTPIHCFLFFCATPLFTGANGRKLDENFRQSRKRLFDASSHNRRAFVSGHSSDRYRHTYTPVS